VKQLDYKIILVFIPVAFLTYIFHEFGHWVFGELTENNMVMNLNYCWPKSGSFITEKHALISSIGGLFFTILQAVIFLLIIEKWNMIYAYPFVFFAFFVRFFSLVFGGFMKQDEVTISTALEIGKYTIAILVVSILILLVWRASIKLKIDLKSNCIFWAISTVALLVVIGSCKIFLK